MPKAHSTSRRRTPAAAQAPVATTHPSALARPSGIDPWTIALGASFLLLVVFAVRYLADADLGYHLKGGQWILEHHQFPVKDIYTYTRSSADYVDLHWLYQILIYATYRAGGYVSLSLLNVVLLGLVSLLTVKRLQATGAPLSIVVPLLLVAILSCEVRFHVRPEVLTWIFMSLMLWVLELRWTRSRNYLFLLPVIQVVWTNAEGLFGIGWGVMGAYLISDLVHSKELDVSLWRYSLLAVLSCLLNPYFMKGALLPFTYLATLDAANPFKQAIAEFRSPWTMGGRFTSPALAILCYQAYSTLLLVLLFATLRKRRAHEFIIAGAFFYLSATALRNIPLFIIATLPLAASSWQAVDWGWFKRWQARSLSTPAAAWVCMLIVLTFAARTITSAHYIDEGRQDRFGLGLDGETQPVGAGAFLVKNRLEGRILNQMNTGGWLDWVRPGQVFLDGRTEVMGEDLFVESMSSLNPGGLQRLIARYQPDILFFTPTTARQWILDLNAMPDWRAVYLDEGACVFLRKDYAPEIPALDGDRTLSERGLARSVGGNAVALLRQPSPPAWKRLVESTFSPAAHPNGLQAMALFFQYRDEPQISEALFLECIRRSRGLYYDFYFNAGLMYYTSGQRDKSRLCMDRVLEDDPDNAGAVRILANLRNN